VTDSFPRRHARTGRFTFGAPRDLRVAADGSRVAFLRSAGGTDPVNRLWAFDVPAGGERLVAEPAVVLAGADAAAVDLPPEERARRERAREGAGGIVAYDADPALTRATFALGGRLFVADLAPGGTARELDAAPGVFDPRLSPGGAEVGYVHGRTLRASAVAGADRELASEADETVSWGSAEFVAAEEMGRGRGFWWGPEGARVAACRVDVSPVPVWWIAAPATPWEAPRPVRYPAAGADNAVVELVVLGPAGEHVVVDWRRGRYEYLCDVQWDERRLTVVAQSRDQAEVAVLVADPVTGATEEVHRISGDPWVEIVAGAPRWAGDRLVTVEDRGDSRRVVVDGTPCSPEGFEVRRVLHADESGVWLLGSEEPSELHVARLDWDGGLERITTEPGVHTAAVGGPTVVVASAGPDHDGTRVVVHHHGEVVAEIASLAEAPGLRPSPEIHRFGPRAVRTAVLLPTGHPPGERLPVLLDPYGGPHALRVQRTRGAFLASQWFADQGFAVVVADGRGTPGRGPVWERSVHLDLAGPVLEDQVDALHEAAARYPELDLSRVAIRGWSFGGYLAALAVLRRPDVFHAAVAGAPVTDWRLYDTHYTERYLGHPAEQPEAYERCDLTAEAASLTRPLLLVHGLADDNVVAAHTLALSQALLEAGRPHRVLPLSGVTHMTPQEVVAENLLLLQLAFLREALGLEALGLEASGLR
jgi:dipeptidyl-peptidase-4